jgi:exodeoxyribonuclease-3
VAQEVASSVHFDAVYQSGEALNEAGGAAATVQFHNHDLAGILLERKPPYVGCAAARREQGSQKQDGASEHSGKVMYLRPMNIISWNVNGLRAVAGKGLHEIVRGLNPDVMGFQEIKCTVDQAKEVLDGLGYHVVAHEADKKGYSGTAIISKIKPISVSYGMGVEEHEGEGRVITAEFQDLYVVTTYVPNSKGDLSRIPQRARWDRDLAAYLQGLDAKKPVVLCGDLNVAHQPIDLTNPQPNYNRTPGYTQSEIDGLQFLLDSGFVDSWREQNPGVVKYSWWSMRSGGRAKNIGWRLDYHLVSRRLMDRVASTEIHNEVYGSDHCPVSLQLA